jgi:hypothetical protein
MPKSQAKASSPAPRKKRKKQESVESLLARADAFAPDLRELMAELIDQLAERELMAAVKAQARELRKIIGPALLAAGMSKTQVRVVMMALSGGNDLEAASLSLILDWRSA